jgi:hypothetical protein
MGDIMKKSTFWWTGIALTASFLLVSAACSPTNYNFIGHWTQKAEPLTYDNQDQRITFINHEQQMKLTFPDDQWQVYTTPTNDYLKAAWKTPTKDKPAYLVMIAEQTKLGMNVQIEVDPVPENIVLEDYMALHEQRLYSVRGIEVLSNYPTECGGRLIGVNVVKGTAETRGTKGMKMITAIFEEEKRFTLLTLATPDSLFESGKEKFWAIADSYEYLEK